MIKRNDSSERREAEPQRAGCFHLWPSCQPGVSPAKPHSLHECSSVVSCSFSLSPGPTLYLARPALQIRPS